MPAATPKELHELRTLTLMRLRSEKLIDGREFLQLKTLADAEAGLITYREYYEKHNISSRGESLEA